MFAAAVFTCVAVACAGATWFTQHSDHERRAKTKVVWTSILRSLCKIICIVGPLVVASDAARASLWMGVAKQSMTGRRVTNAICD